MPELSSRDCKYKRKNSFRQNFPGKIPDSAAKGMLRAIRPSNAAPHGGRAAAKTDTATASGPQCRDRDPRRNSRRNAQTIRSPEGEIIRPIGPEPRLHFQAVSGQHPGNELHPLTTGRRGPLPLFQTTVSANAIGPEHPVLPPVRTRLPGNGAVRLAGPASTQKPFRTKSYGKRRSPGPAERPVPNRLRTHPECLLEKQTPPAAGPEVSRIYPGIGLPPKPGPDQRTLNPSSARTGMGRLA